MLLKARADKCRVDVETIIRMNMDAIAIMGHTTYNLAQRRRDVIRPTPNKDYATLCATFSLWRRVADTAYSHSSIQQNKKQLVDHIHHSSTLTHQTTHQQDQAHKSLFYGSRHHRAAKISTEGNTSIDPTNRRIRDPPPINILTQMHSSTIQVSMYETLLLELLEYFKHKVTIFKAGCLAAHAKEWQSSTSDFGILETLSGQKIEFFTPPVQLNPLTNVNFTEKQTKLVDLEIEKLLSKDVIVPCTQEEDEFVSPIFTRPKKDGTFRMILNLKSLNKFVTYHHFKMDTIWTAIKSMTPGCYMASMKFEGCMLFSPNPYRFSEISEVSM